MLNWLLFISIFIVFSSEGFAQKLMEKQWESIAVERIEIYSDDIFKIKIRAIDTEVIRLQAVVEGEHSESVLIASRLENKVLQLSTSFKPFHKQADDKLAAHKVISIEIELLVPEQIAVAITSKLASVYGDGKFSLFEASLQEGDCGLYNFEGNASLMTVDGRIVVYTTGQVTGTAVSKNGIVSNLLPKKGKYNITAESTNGAILLTEYY